jgi:hypothetical protein
MNTLIVSIMGIVLGAMLSFVASLYFFKRNAELAETKRIATEHEALLKRVAELETTVRMVGQTILPMSTAFQAILVKELTHFHTPEVDALLEKLGPPSTISEEDMVLLEIALKRRTAEVDPLVDESEREAALILPYIIKRVRRQCANADAPIQIQLVSVQ